MYLGDAVELAYRLPRIWARVTAGEVPVWKARKVAQATRALTVEAAAAVDKALYFVLRRCSFAEIDRQVDKARAEHDPAEAERRRVEAAERRHFHVHLKFMTSDGLVPVSGMLDVADAVRQRRIKSGWVHFKKFGLAEGRRQTTRDEEAATPENFDEAGYLASNRSMARSPLAEDQVPSSTCKSASGTPAASRVSRQPALRCWASHQSMGPEMWPIF